jgi:hypothetical protein
MPAAGEVYHYPDYVFPDGEQAHKYVVLLGQIPGGDWILCRSTSKQHGRPTDPRCNQSGIYPSYYLGTIQGIFPVATWLVLDRLDDHDEMDFNQKLALGAVTMVGTLSVDLLCQLLACARGADDTTQVQATAMSNVRANLNCP